MAAARAELTTLGALDDRGALTDMGRRLRRLPVPPRLARMIVGAAETGHAVDAAMIAAVLVERGLGGTGTDLDQRLASFARDRSRRAGDMRALARGWAKIAEDDAGRAAHASIADRLSTAALLATAYPDRIATARGAPGQYLLANGRAAMLDAADPLALAPFLVVAEVSGVAARARILLAAATNEAEVRAIAADRIEMAEEAAFDPASAAVRTRRTERLGAIVLRSETRPTRPGPEVAALLARGIAGLGIDRLPWSSAQRQLRTRIAFVRAAAKRGADAWPDLSDATLAATVADWLTPFLGSVTSLAGITADLLGKRTRCAAAVVRPRKPRCACADSFHRADRQTSSDRLRGRRRADPGDPRAGVVRPHRPSRDRQRPPAADAASPLAGPSTDPDHARSPRLLGRIMGRRARRHARPLSEAPLARGPALGAADQPRQTARNVTLARKRCRAARRIPA